MLTAVWKKNDKKANIIIISFSLVIFLLVTAVGNIHFPVALPFDPHLFALANAIINSCVAVLLVAALIAAKQRKYQLHKTLMFIAMLFSLVFLLSYVAHHFFAGETHYGGSGIGKTIYFIILFTHIPLAAIIMPFVLYSAYRALTGEFEKHRKLTKITWPIWFYVAVTGVVVYLMISPYYK